mgnify:CR=1 FL=1
MWGEPEQIIFSKYSTNNPEILANLCSSAIFWMPRACYNLLSEMKAQYVWEADWLLSAVTMIRLLSNSDAFLEQTIVQPCFSKPQTSSITTCPHISHNFNIIEIIASAQRNDLSQKYILHWWWSRVQIKKAWQSYPSRIVGVQSFELFTNLPNIFVLNFTHLF